MRILRCILVMLASLGLVVPLAFASLCFEIDSYGRKDLAQPADAIVVLGALVLPDGQPGPDLTVRTRHAVALYQAGLAPHLICTGGIKDEPTSAAAVSRALAISLGVPQERILLADGSASTEEDAKQVATVMHQHGWRTAIVVSHPLHVYRVKLFIEKEGLTVYTSPTNTDVDGIALPWRVYYTIREGVGILWPYLEEVGFPPTWTATLQRWVYAGPW
jgi:uncharacterized SAM-binding protein YcdF (DUF218 family)